MATLTQLPATLDIQTVRGDDFSFTLAFGTALTGYTFTASVLKPDGTEAVAFTQSSVTATGMVLSLTDAQTDALTCAIYSWSLIGTVAGYTRTLVVGEFKLT